MINDKACRPFFIGQSKSAFNKAQGIPSRSSECEQFLVKDFARILWQGRAEIDQTGVTWQPQFSIKTGKRCVEIAYEIF